MSSTTSTSAPVGQVATVGLGTFLVSFFAAVWVVLFAVGRLRGTARAWRLNMLGAGMLGIVILVLATIQNTPTVEGIVPVYSTYWRNTGAIAAVMSVALCATLFSLCWWDLPRSRRAKLVPGTH